ncbi:MAG: prepilin-type N-terminal cleavage/methylation domain-containing protein [Candidatus Edwardsbacteria bacterium]|nr:prepilin-type N-terminal cleavage/methylation domain-containing protein [Candidatus Edwardsbacteria bacterium]
MAENRRRKILAHKDMQIRIVAQILAMVASGILLVGGAVYLIIWNGITGPAYASGQTSLINIFDQVHKTLFIVIPVLILIMGWISIVISHRIAGPLVRLNNGMKSLEKGDWPKHPMKFRKNDEGHHLAEQFNVMTESIRKMVAGEQEAARSVLSELEVYTRKLKEEQKVDREIIEKLNRIQEKAAKTSQKGFTLIELMIVVVIIGVLAAISIPNYLSMRDRAIEASLKSNMHTLQLVVEDFNTRTGGFYPADLTVRISDITGNDVHKSITEGATKPPFPPNTLICPYMSYANPFNRNDHAVIYLPNDAPVGPSGVVYFTGYDAANNIIPEGSALVAVTYKIRGFGKDRILNFNLSPGNAI